MDKDAIDALRVLLSSVPIKTNFEKLKQSIISKWLSEKDASARDVLWFEIQAIIKLEQSLRGSIGAAELNLHNKK